MFSGVFSSVFLVFLWGFCGGFVGFCGFFVGFCGVFLWFCGGFVVFVGFCGGFVVFCGVLLGWFVGVWFLDFLRLFEETLVDVLGFFLGFNSFFLGFP